MFNLLISLGVGVAVALFFWLTGFAWYADIIPAVIATVLAFVLLTRRIAKRLEAITTEAQRELSIQAANTREQKARIEKGIRILESALIYSKWQFLIASEIHAQIGMIKYMVKDFDGALASFEKSSTRNAMAHAMKAALCFQRKNYDEMTRSFETSVKNGKKESLYWSAYAWCLTQTKEKEKAMRVLARGLETNPSDERLKAGLTALQNDKKLKMKPYGTQWWQLGLEAPPPSMPSGRAVRFQRQ